MGTWCFVCSFVWSGTCHSETGSPEPSGAPCRLTSDSFCVFPLPTLAQGSRWRARPPALTITCKTLGGRKWIQKGQPFLKKDTPWNLHNFLSYSVHLVLSHLATAMHLPGSRDSWSFSEYTYVELKI